MKESPVLFEVNHGVGWITLNRPRVLNSLDLEMVTLIEENLKQWAYNTDVAMVCVLGAGEKGLCAGGDIRDLYDHQHSNVVEHASSFFTTEYLMDFAFRNFSKPVLVYMDGVVMGGGVGLSVGASHRIVTEKTKWAMPEMNIGFFPDVGSSYFLNRLPGHIGRYLALTSTVIAAEDVLYLGLADYYLEREGWESLKQALSEKNWTACNNAVSDLNGLIARFAKTTYEHSPLQAKKRKIDEHFSYDSVEEIIHSLGKSSQETDDWEDKTRKNLLSKSPTSLKVALKQQQEGKYLAYAECLRMELNMALNFMNHADFYEGVRSMLVDKDKSPKWLPASLEEVPESSVSSFFHYQWPAEKHPLIDMEAENSAK